MQTERWPKMERAGDLDLSGGGGEGGSVTPDPDPNPPSPASPTGSGNESPFKHPGLAGLSEEEIATRLSVLNTTVNEQGARLTRMTNERVAPAAPVAPQTPFTDPSSAEFFESPAKVTRAIVEETVRKQLREIVDPLMADMRVQKSVGMIDGLKKQYPDFDAHWPYITDQLGKYGIALEAATEESLETLYLKSVGLNAIRGVRPVEGDRSRAAPPQHRPSNQPIPPVQPKKIVRELTEGERRMARIQGFKTDDEYLKYQELYADEVLGGEA